MKNVKENLGENAISDDAFCNICCSLLENSKSQYFTTNTNISESSPIMTTTPNTSYSSSASSASLNSTDLAASSLSTATTPKMELSETESDSSQNNNNFCSTGSSILHQALKRRRIDEIEEHDETDPDTCGEEISDELLKIAEEISEEDLSQAFSFEDSLLSDIPCLSLSPPPLMDALNTDTDTTDFKVPLPPIETIKGVSTPFSSFFVPNTEPCLDFIDFDFE